MQRKVTIEDISRETGLSRGTVSRALNNRPDISQRTKQKVLEVCRALNYTPSHAARSLATGRSYTLAVVVTSLTDATSCAILRAALRTAEASRYAVQVVELGLEPETRRDRLRTLSADRLDGVLLCEPLQESEAADLAERFASRPFASATPQTGISGDFFLVDERGIGGEIGRFLQRHGERGAYLHQGDGNERLTALRQGAPEARIFRGGADSVPLESFRAVATEDDNAALALLVRAAVAGLGIGRDIEILGVGNSEIAAAVEPGLSSIDPGGADIGHRALETLLQRISGDRKDRPESVTVRPRLIARASAPARG